MADPPTRARATSGEVVFTFSSLSWGAAAKRGWFGSEDRLALTLVEHERVERVLVCDRARSLPLKLLRDRMAGPEEAFPQDPNKRLLSPVRARRTDATSLRGVAREMGAYGRAMERGARKMGLENPVVITTHPLVAGFAELGWAKAVTYYALDDWTVHAGYSRWWPAYEAAYARIREAGLRVAAVSSALLERLDPKGPGLVVPNGLEPAEWLGSIEEREQPEDLDSAGLDSAGLDSVSLEPFEPGTPDPNRLPIPTNRSSCMWEPWTNAWTWTG